MSENTDSEPTGWRGFDEKPDHPMMVEYFFGNYPPLDLPPYRDERRHIGFFDGRDFREIGTGHKVFESWRGVESIPTHWRQAVESPDA